MLDSVQSSTADAPNTDSATDNNANPEYLDPNRRRTEGYVIECDSRKAVIIAPVDPNIDYMENYWAVGQQISIWVGEHRVIGQSFLVESATDGWEEEGRNDVRVHLELIGEAQTGKNGAKFSTGISNFPQMGCVAHRIRHTDLAAIYENNAEQIVNIGHLTQDNSIEAVIDVEKMLSRHFAVVGSTGVGKSTSVTLMLRKIVEARKDIRVLMLDPHNEFSSAFPKNSIVIGANELQLPFWMFGLEEFAEVVFRGQKNLRIERELLRDLIVLAKEKYSEDDTEVSTLVRKKKERKNISADLPVPYRLADLIKIINDRIGLLDNKAEKPLLKFLKEKLESIVSDLRFRFMFDQNICGGDKIEEVISRIFRIPQNGKPICVLEMSGLPSEVVSSVASVLCRMAFELALSSEGGIQTLVVCEEAHRYIPADETAGFWPTRQAIGRIAKEGRKYGVYLGIITQRPSELDPTILSQCNTFFAMRLSNQKDQDIVAGAFNSGAQSTISFLSSISNRECIAFGEALHSPMRMTFETVAQEDLPGANIRENQDAVRAGKIVNVQTIISKMRKESEGTLSQFESDDLAALVETPGVDQRNSTPAPVTSRIPGYVPEDVARNLSPNKPEVAVANSTEPTRQPTQEEILEARAKVEASIAKRSGIEARDTGSDPAAKPAQRENRGNSLIGAFRSK